MRFFYRGSKIVLADISFNFSRCIYILMLVPHYFGQTDMDEVLILLNLVFCKSTSAIYALVILLTISSPFPGVEVSQTYPAF